MIAELSAESVRRIESRAKRILVVDDEPHVRKFLRFSLEAEGFAVQEASTASDALEAVRVEEPDLIILDLGLPDLDGQDVLREIRLGHDMPILVLSGRTEDCEKIVALDDGADDYMTKPFEIREMVLRVRAALGHDHFVKDQAGGEVVRTGRLLVSLSSSEVLLDGRVVGLEPEEYDLLRVLARHGGRVVTFSRLVRVLWGQEDKDASFGWRLQKLVASLRRKIEEEPSFPEYIVTEPAVGYRLAFLLAVSNDATL